MFKQGDLVKIKNDTLCINREQAASMSNTSVFKVLDASDVLVVLTQSDFSTIRARPAENYELLNAETTKNHEKYESATDVSTNEDWGLF